jgi:fructokinase
MAGLLDALAGAGLLGADRSGDLHSIPRDGLAAAVRRATRVAAITCTRPGADPPTGEELVAAYPGEG